MRRMSKYILVIGMLPWIAAASNNLAVAREIPGWPGLDADGIPMSWYLAAKKWLGPRAFGDVTGNGKENVVVAKGAGIAIFEKGPDGKWTEIAEYVHPYGAADVRSIAIGDTDRDGKKEIYFGTAQGNNPANGCRVYIFEHTGGNNFAQIGVLGPYGDIVRRVAIGDANGDGKDEVIATQGLIRIYAATEDNIWEEIWKNAEYNDDDRYFNGVAAADLDRDGKPELYLGVERYDSGAKKSHGWLDVYEMSEKNKYEKIWESDDMEAFVSDVKLLKAKETGKVFVAGQLRIRPYGWALFECAGENSYAFKGVKPQKDIDLLFDAP